MMTSGKKQTINRRNFIHRSVVMSAAGSIAAALPSCTFAGANGRSRTLVPKPLMNGGISLSKPLLDESQLSFRIGLARTRMASYPCNSLDFIMLDLTRPAGRTRKAHWSTGDLTGRLLEFLCCAEGVDGKQDPRLDELFERILKQRQPDGFIGRYSLAPNDIPQQEDPFRWAAASKLFSGLLRYYDLTGDKRALEAAEGLAGLLWSVRDVWKEAIIKEQGYIGILHWVTEPFARLYGITKDQRWMDFCAMIRENIRPLEGRRCHSHGYLSTLRGFQVMTLLTGDLSWNIIPDQGQRLIIENHFEMADGCVPEFFPTNDRTEGCSIADWMMLNLNQGLIHGDDRSYDKAERIFWNALAFNQLITGGFGHRRIASNGYGLDQIHEAWWCCTPDAGMSLSELARHIVTFRENVIHVNFLFPGKYEIPLPDGKHARITIATAYPSRAEATIVVENVPETFPVRIRVPEWVRNPVTKRTIAGKKVQLAFMGEMGHRIEQVNPGVIVTYGPLVLVPTRSVKVGSYNPAEQVAKETEGYDPQSMPGGIPGIQLLTPPDANGFVKLPLCPPDRPLPPWNYWDEGPGSPTWVEGSAAEVTLLFPDGNSLPVRFSPMCYNTSSLSLFETPVVFGNA